MTLMEFIQKPGETRALLGFVRAVVTKEPSEKAIAKGAKAKPPYVPKSETVIELLPHGLPLRKVKFDPEKFPVSKLNALAGCGVTLNCVVKAYSFNDDETGELKTGETTWLDAVAAIHTNADGSEYVRKAA